MYILTDYTRNNTITNFPCTALLCTAEGSDITVLSNGRLKTSNGKLKGLGEKQAPLPVITSRIKYQHISNLNLSIPYECAKM
jgi:hypothetical protein